MERELKVGDYVLMKSFEEIEYFSFIKNRDELRKIEKKVGKVTEVDSYASDIYVDILGYGSTTVGYDCDALISIDKEMYNVALREYMNLQKNEELLSNETINSNKGEDSMFKTTIEGRIAIKSNDGFYYSVTDTGAMKREYTVFENISEVIKREKTALQLGDIVDYKNNIVFCSLVSNNQYSFTNFKDRSVINVQKGDESDGLGETYSVLINPIQSILETDKTVDATTLLSNNPNNAQKLSLALQQQQNSSLGDIAKALKGFINE